MTRQGKAFGLFKGGGEKELLSGLDRKDLFSCSNTDLSWIKPSLVSLTSSFQDTSIKVRSFPSASSRVCIIRLRRVS